MIRNRQFMLGLGAGLIAGALLLQLMMIGQGTGKLQTRAQIEQAAALLNLKVVAADRELLTEEEWKEKQEGAGGQEANPAKEPKAPNVPGTPKPPGKPETSKTPDTSKVPAASKTPVEAATPKTEAPVKPQSPQKTTVTYKISSGSTLSGVAEGLEKAGVIPDKSAFLKEAKSKKINTKIRTGTFTFEPGEDITSIISKITSAPAE
ncbi:MULTISPECIES: hypothetical protein [Paenibacillus]|uniref:hypothetical protein n=1 Tax=Paenibacillus TaxID=44249 RepID=UPI002FE11963